MILSTCQKTTVTTDQGPEHRETEGCQGETATIKEKTDVPLGTDSGKRRGCREGQRSLNGQMWEVQVEGMGEGCG